MNFSEAFIDFDSDSIASLTSADHCGSFRIYFDLYIRCGQVHKCGDLFIQRFEDNVVGEERQMTDFSIEDQARIYDAIGRKLVDINDSYRDEIHQAGLDAEADIALDDMRSEPSDE